MTKYTITIRPPEKDKSPSMYSAYCKEYDITTEGQTPEEALSCLFDMIRIVNDLEDMDFKMETEKSSITFQIPTIA